jgi:hypothetical protein
MTTATLKFEVEKSFSNNTSLNIDLFDNDKELGLDCIMLDGESVLLTSLYENTDYNNIK